MGPDFTEEQKRYLEGFFSGLLTRRGAGAGSPPPVAGTNGAASPAGAPASEPACHQWVPIDCVTARRPGC